MLNKELRKSKSRLLSGKSRLFAGKKRQVVLFTILLITIANCQSWNILTNNDNKFKFDNMYSVQNDTLIGLESEKTIKVPIKDISNIWYNNVSIGRGIIGAGLGGLLGGIVGIFAGVAIVDNYETGSAAGLVIGAIAGGMLFSKSIGKHYILSNMTIEQKIAKINSLIEKYEKRKKN